MGTTADPPLGTPSHSSLGTTAHPPLGTTPFPSTSVATPMVSTKAIQATTTLLPATLLLEMGLGTLRVVGSLRGTAVGWGWLLQAVQE